MKRGEQGSFRCEVSEFFTLWVYPDYLDETSWILSVFPLISQLIPTHIRHLKSLITLFGRSLLLLSVLPCYCFFSRFVRLLLPHTIFLSRYPPAACIHAYGSPVYSCGSVPVGICEKRGTCFTDLSGSHQQELTCAFDASDGVRRTRRTG